MRVRQMRERRVLTINLILAEFQPIAEEFSRRIELLRQEKEVHLLHLQGGESMSTIEGNRITVTYVIAEGVTNEQAQEQLTESAPEGFMLQHVSNEETSDEPASS